MKGNYLKLVILLICLTFFQSANAKVKLGLTWKWSLRHNNINVDMIGCNGCDAYKGDTPCTKSLPILCFSQSNFNRPPYEVYPIKGGAMPAEFYHGWSGGMFLTTEPIVGKNIGSKADADKICSDKFGTEFIAAHHGTGKYVMGMNSTNLYYSTWPSSTIIGGWHAFGYGKVSQTKRFWVFIDSQPANCWD